MLFGKKKKGMVDLRELQKRGVVRIPTKKISIPADNEGFVELGNTPNSQLGPNRVMSTEEPTPNSSKSNTDFFGFIDTPATDQTDNFSTESDGYNKREVDAKITNLDNKIYKLEQRIELLEKKLDVNQSTSNVGAMGW
ncbi:hypothetical protein HN903_01610 [archaeon]|jgi:hypothetical protein|nr:hypothetical protein [archaeon]MBT7128429.1 hypothetical protein [archaeon]